MRMRMDLAVAGAAALLFVTGVRPVAADPSTFGWGNYLGGTGSDSAYALAVDPSSGEVVVAGVTGSADFPTSAGAFQPSYGGNGDAYVAKFSADGATLLWATYLGGTNSENAQAVTVDATGNVYVVGTVATGPSGGPSDFPVTAGAYRTSTSNGSGGFVVKLSPSGSQLLYGTYLAGASGSVVPLGIDVATDGTLFVVGHATAGFPTTAGAFDVTHSGSADPFLLRLAPNGGGPSDLLYSTLLSAGSNGGSARSVAIDPAGDVYVAGKSITSKTAPFPTTTNAYRPSVVWPKKTTSMNVSFLAKFRPGGQGTADLLYSTILGADGSVQTAHGIALDGQGRVHVVGQSSSIPTTPNALDPTPESSYSNGFVLVLDPQVAGSAGLVYSTYLGGDTAKAVAVDGNGRSCVTGWIPQSGAFPTTAGALQQTPLPGSGGTAIDLFYSLIDTSAAPAAQLVYSTRFGGTSIDRGYGVGVGPSGAVFVGGHTQNASGLPAPMGPYDATFNGATDALILRFGP